MHIYLHTQSCTEIIRKMFNTVYILYKNFVMGWRVPKGTAQVNETLTTAAQLKTLHWENKRGTEDYYGEVYQKSWYASMYRKEKKKHECILNIFTSL